MIYLNQSGTWLEWDFAGSGGWIASSGPSACGGGSGPATTSFYPVADTLRKPELTRHSLGSAAEITGLETTRRPVIECHIE
jgi:hypothetical protein